MPSPNTNPQGTPGPAPTTPTNPATSSPSSAGPAAPTIPSSGGQTSVRLRLSQVWGIVAVTLSAASAVSVYLEPWTSQVITMKAELTALKSEVAALRADVQSCTCP